MICRSILIAYRAQECLLLRQNVEFRAIAFKSTSRFVVLHFCTSGRA